MAPFPTNANLMSRIPSSSVLFLILMAASALINAHTCAAVRPDPLASKSLNFIRSSCSATQFPNLCFTSLSAYAATIQTSPVQLAHAALSVSLATARNTAATITNTLKRSGGTSSREAEAMSDCVDQIADSVDELRKSLKEMGELGPKNFKLCVNDMQTWVSSALTDENTCMEGLPPGSAAGTSLAKGGERAAVRGEIVKAAQLTSNALSLINGLGGV